MWSERKKKKKKGTFELVCKLLLIELFKSVRKSILIILLNQDYKDCKVRTYVSKLRERIPELLKRRKARGKVNL